MKLDVLAIAAHPDDAEIYLYRYAERDRILVPGAEQFLGYTPLRNEPIGMGSEDRERRPAAAPAFGSQGEQVRRAGRQRAAGPAALRPGRRRRLWRGEQPARGKHRGPQRRRDL